MRSPLLSARTPPRRTISRKSAGRRVGKNRPRNDCGLARPHTQGNSDQQVTAALHVLSIDERKYLGASPFATGQCAVHRLPGCGLTPKVGLLDDFSRSNLRPQSSSPPSAAARVAPARTPGLRTAVPVHEGRHLVSTPISTVERAKTSHCARARSDSTAGGRDWSVRPLRYEGNPLKSVKVIQAGASVPGEPKRIRHRA